MPASLDIRSASCLVASPFSPELVSQAAAACLKELGEDPDLVFAFVSSDYRPHLQTFIETIQIDGHASILAGGSACGLAGVGKEQELVSGMSLLFLKLPNTAISILSEPKSKTSPDSAILLSHPLVSDYGELLQTWDRHHSGVPLVGGTVTGGPDPVDLFLFDQDGEVAAGNLFIEFCGGIRIRPLIAHGCRPIGEPLIVTSAREDEVISLGKREPFEVLEETFLALGEDLQMEAYGHIFAGLAIDESTDMFEVGDFHIHQIVSMRLEDGRLRLGAPVRTGQTLQFQLRDSLAAEAELRTACERVSETEGNPFASLLFLGKGRGRRLFGVENRNIDIFEEFFGQMPLAGIYSFGEFGSSMPDSLRYDHSVCGALFYPSSAETGN